jgi:hypothetical protein
MALVTDRCRIYFHEVCAKAEKMGVYESLKKQLDYLDGYACPDGDKTKTRCTLFKDFAPMSFTFNMDIRDEASGEYKSWFNGGLIFYAGSESGVGAPQLSVSLSRAMGQEKAAGWEVHT